MNNFSRYITPQEAKEHGDTRSIELLTELSKDNSHCDCGEQVWRYAGVGLCFSCTTGESDASGDYELARFGFENNSAKEAL
jgi:hypothetical protein